MSSANTIQNRKNVGGLCALPSNPKKQKITKFPELETREKKEYKKVKENFFQDMGWGRLIFANTFNKAENIMNILHNEKEEQRDIVVYSRYPHIIISKAPHEVFLDPSYFYRFWLEKYNKTKEKKTGFTINPIESKKDAEGTVQMLKARKFICPEANYIWKKRKTKEIMYVVAKEEQTGKIIGTVQALDHKLLFNDAENGASFWELAVDPQATQPGIGLALVDYLLNFYKKKGRAYLDLSVMADNKEATRLYKKMGFKKIYSFALKKRNPINEPLFSAPKPQGKLNPYSEIIINEAKKRGIIVEIVDENNAYFSLMFGGRRIRCRESLSELTNAFSMSICQDKEVTGKILKKEGFNTPNQINAENWKDNLKFLKKYKKIVVKPAFGKSGKGFSIGINNIKNMKKAIERAKKSYEKIIIENFVGGQDLRTTIIDFEFIAGVVRKPPVIKGTGKHTIEELIKKYNRRRMSATKGESKVPLDDQTKISIKDEGYKLASILPKGKNILLRKNSNLHTGGTLHDVTEKISPALKETAVQAAKALDIPVVGINFIVPRLNGKEYCIIGVNERPGLVNREPQPTAEKFIDLLFPQTTNESKKI